MMVLRGRTASFSVLLPRHYSLLKLSTIATRVRVVSHTSTASSRRLSSSSNSSGSSNSNNNNANHDMNINIDLESKQENGKSNRTRRRRREGMLDADIAWFNRRKSIRSMQSHFYISGRSGFEQGIAVEISAYPLISSVSRDSPVDIPCPNSSSPSSISQSFPNALSQHLWDPFHQQPSSHHLPHRNFGVRFAGASNSSLPSTAPIVSFSTYTDRFQTYPSQRTVMQPESHKEHATTMKEFFSSCFGNLREKFGKWPTGINTSSMRDGSRSDISKKDMIGLMLSIVAGLTFFSKGKTYLGNFRWNVFRYLGGDMAFENAKAAKFVTLCEGSDGQQDTLNAKTERKLSNRVMNDGEVLASSILEQENSDESDSPTEDMLRGEDGHEEEEGGERERERSEGTKSRQSRKPETDEASSDNVKSDASANSSSNSSRSTSETCSSSSTTPSSASMDEESNASTTTNTTTTNNTNPAATASTATSQNRSRKGSRYSTDYTQKRKESRVSSVSVHSTRGPRPAMEDRSFISKSMNFFAVYDGHGGFYVAETARKDLYGILQRELEEHGEAPTAEAVENALFHAFETVSEKVLADSANDMQGSTAVAVLLHGDSFYSANLGDSRAVLCRNGSVIDLTVDHKPNLESERSRIESLGGQVDWYGYRGPDGLPVPGMGAYRINGNLAVSRAFGDRLEQPYLSSEPDIRRFERKYDEDHFIIIASDGLWDVMTSEESVDFVQQILAGSFSSRSSATLSRFVKGYAGDRGMLRAVIDKRRSKMAQYLVEESLRRGTSDNVSAIVIWLR